MVLDHMIFFSDVDECLNDPCLNDGTCNNTEGSYFCACMDGWTDFNCQTSKKQFKDNYISQRFMIGFRSALFRNSFSSRGNQPLLLLAGVFSWS